MIAAVAAFLARSALMQSRLGALLKAVPRQVWFAVLVIAAIGAAYVWHQHVARNAIADAKAEQKAADDAQAAGWALVIKGEADAVARKAAGIAKEKNDEAHGRIDAVADALVLHGPGRAACSSPAGSAAAADERPVGNDEADGAVADMHREQWQPLVGLPFTDAVAFAAQNDRCIADLRAYEQRDALIATGTAKLQAESPAARPSKPTGASK